MLSFPMNQQRNGRGMYTDPSSGYRYEGNLTILWCPVRGQWGGGGGRAGRGILQVWFCQLR